MLRLIICPKCGTEYKKQDIYFCFNCGARLPREEKTEKHKDTGGGGKNTVNKNKTVKATESNSEKKDNKYNIRLIILALIFLASTTLFIYTYNVHLKLKNLSTRILDTEPRNAITTEATPSAIPRITFNNERAEWLKYYASLVPQNIDFFLITGHDTNLYLPQIEGELLAELETALGIEIKEALTYIEPEYALVQQASESALLATAKNPKFVQQLISPLTESGIQEYTPKMHNTLLVVSNSESLHKQIENVIKNAELSMAQDPNFDSAKRKLPNKGQIFIFGKSVTLWLIPDEFRPDQELSLGFVIDKENGKTIYYNSD